MNRKKERKQTTKHFKLFTTNYIYRTRCATVEWLPLRLMSDRARDKERRRSTLWEKFNFDMEKGQFSYHVSRVVVLQVQIYFVLSGLSFPALDKMKKFTLMLDDFSHCTPITVRVSCWWWSVHAINRYQFVFRVFLSKVDKCSRYECLAVDGILTLKLKRNGMKAMWNTISSHTCTRQALSCDLSVRGKYFLFIDNNFQLFNHQNIPTATWVFKMNFLIALDIINGWMEVLNVLVVEVVYLYSSEHALSG